MTTKVTQADIALATNLSNYAVSRALSGKSGVSEETRARVLNARKTLGYVKYETKDDNRCILMVIPESDLNDPTFWMKVLQGIENVAKRNHYALQVKVVNQNEDAMIINDIEKASGIIYAGNKSLEYAQKYINSRPSLLMTYPPESLFEMDVIHTGDREAGYALCKKLIEWGHTKFGFYGTTDRPSTFNQLEGVRDAMKFYGLTLANIWNDVKYIQTSNMMEELKILKNSNNLPTVIMCSYERLAQSLIYMLNNLHLAIPNDISITAFNCDLGETQSIPLTGSGLNKFEYGRMAFDVLRERIENPNLPYKRITILPKLLIQETTGPIDRA
jgi:LacI family transcriptional regulator